MEARPHHLCEFGPFCLDTRERSCCAMAVRYRSNLKSMKLSWRLLAEAVTSSTREELMRVGLA